MNTAYISLPLLLMMLTPAVGEQRPEVRPASTLGARLHEALSRSDDGLSGIKNAGSVKGLIEQKGCPEFDYRLVRVDGEKPFLYAIAFAKSASHVAIGRHFRFTVENGAADLEAISTSSCLALNWSPDAVGLVVTHFLTREPTEFHVLASLLSGLPLHVGINDVVWLVDGTNISVLKKSGT